MEYNNYLCHRKYKYIKKVKGKNGKYRYIYDVKDALGFDEREAYRRTQAIADKASKEYDDAHDNFSKRISDDFHAVFNNRHIDSFGATDNSLSKHMEQQTDIAMRNLHKARSKANAKKTMSDNALRKYQKTPLYKMEDAIDTGKYYLRRLVKGY